MKLPALNLCINPETDTSHEKRSIIAVILDHYKALGLAEPDLFEHAYELWSLPIDLLQVELSACIDQLILDCKKIVNH